MRSADEITAFQEETAKEINTIIERRWQGANGIVGIVHRAVRILLYRDRSSAKSLQLSLVGPEWFCGSHTLHDVDLVAATPAVHSVDGLGGGLYELVDRNSDLVVIAHHLEHVENHPSTAKDLDLHLGRTGNGD